MRLNSAKGTYTFDRLQNCKLLLHYKNAKTAVRLLLSRPSTSIALETPQANCAHRSPKSRPAAQSQQGPCHPLYKPKQRQTRRILIKAEAQVYYFAQRRYYAQPAFRRKPQTCQTAKCMSTIIWLALALGEAPPPQPQCYPHHQRFAREGAPMFCVDASVKIDASVSCALWAGAGALSTLARPAPATLSATRRAEAPPAVGSSAEPSIGRILACALHACMKTHVPYC